MGRAANPENVRMIQEIERRRKLDPKMSVPKACREIGLSVHTYNSWRQKQRIKEEERQAWAHVGKRWA